LKWGAGHKQATRRLQPSARLALGIVAAFLNGERFELINIESVSRVHTDPFKDQLGTPLLYLHKNLMHQFVADFNLPTFREAIFQHDQLSVPLRRKDSFGMKYRIPNAPKVAHYFAPNILDINTCRFGKSRSYFILPICVYEDDDGVGQLSLIDAAGRALSDEIV
jgi:hypothetical protein